MRSLTVYQRIIKLKTRVNTGHQVMDTVTAAVAATKARSKYSVGQKKATPFTFYVPVFILNKVIYIYIYYHYIHNE